MFLATQSPLVLRQLWDAETSTFTYLVGDPLTRQAVIIDPVIEHVERDANLIKELDLKITYLLNTHVHADHITGTGLLKKKFPGTKSVLGKRGNDLAMSDVKLLHGECISIGESLNLEVRETPGHTAGCVTYVLQDRVARRSLAAFTGDTLLIRGCGRTDFQGGSAKDLYASVWNQIFSLHDATVILPAHDYKGRTSSTVGEEKKYNPRLTKSLAEFETIMNGLNLSYPNKIDVALPANRLCGLHEISTAVLQPATVQGGVNEKKV